MTDRILIPDKLYVGIQRRNQGARPLAALTAWGTDASAKGRMATVDSYAKDAVTLTNEPLRGFRLHERHVWKDELWLEDPRGFSVSVKASWMLNMLHTCTMIQGEIQEPLVWARSSGHNVILNTQHEQYDRAKLQTEVANSKLSWKEARVGNQITLSSGIRGQYLGKTYGLHRDASGWASDQGQLSVDNTAKIMILQTPQSWKTGNRTITQELHSISSATLARVDDASEMTAQEAELFVNEQLTNANCYVRQGYNSGKLLCAFNKFSWSDCEIKLVPVDMTFQDIYTVNHKAFVIAPSGELAHVGSMTKQHDATLYVYDGAAFNQGMVKYKMAPSGPYKNHKDVLKETMKLNANTRFQALEITLRTKLGNTLVARY